MVVAPALVSIGALLALAVLVGLQYGYNYSLGRIMLAASSLFASVVIKTPFGDIHPLGFAADAIDGADHAIRHAIGRGIEDMQTVFNDSVAYLGYAFRKIGEEIANLTNDTAQTVEALWERSVPKWITRRLGAALAAIAALRATVVSLEHAGVRVIEKQAKAVAKRVTYVQNVIAVPDLPAIPRTIPKVGHLERDIADLWKRVRGLTTRTGSAIVIGSLLAALAKIGIQWARCSNVSKIGKRACGLNPSVLEALLADTLLVVGTISLVEYAEGMQTIVGDISWGARRFWRVAELPSESHISPP